MSDFGSHSRRGGLARTGQVRADCGDSGGRYASAALGQPGWCWACGNRGFQRGSGWAGRACGSRRDLGAAVDLASPSRQLSRFTHEPQLEPAPVALRMSLTLRAPSAISALTAAVVTAWAYAGRTRLSGRLEVGGAISDRPT